MKKQIQLVTKDGLQYAVTLNASLVSGAVTIESCVKTAQLFGNFKPVTEKTLSVKAENGPKKYLVSLIKADDGEFEAVIDDITAGATKPLWQVIAGKNKLSQAVYDELCAVNDEFQALYKAVNEEDQKQAVLTAMRNTMWRTAVKLSDSIAKQNAKNGSIYTAQDFINFVIRNSDAAKQAAH